MEVGLPCRLDVSLWDANLSTGSSDAPFFATVTGYVVGERRHVEDASRVLYYFHTTAVDDPAGVEGSSAYFHAHSRERLPTVARARDDESCPTVSEQTHASGSSPSVHGTILNSGMTATAHSFHSTNGAGVNWSNVLSVTSQGFVSSAGYRYRFDGWYEELYLYPIAAEPLDSIPAEWLLSMEQATAACEVRLLSYAFRPWFDSPFQTLQYLAYPERNVCYTVWLCHRCLSPFFSQRHLATHLEGYCGMRDPPGTLLYRDPASGLEVRHVDGAQHLHYCRCLSLLGKLFIESKVLNNDVDIYEYFIVTMPRTALPFLPGDTFASEAEFRDAASHFDTDAWSGRVLAGYFSRLKHSPHHTLSCILTLPVFQQLHLGSFMLDMAYTLMAERQRQCGCRRHCGNPAVDGGSIGRPFSPHGQTLLLSYWRRALLRAIAPAVLSATDNGAWTEGGGVCFASVGDVRRAMDIPIAREDLTFLLLHENFAFYGPREVDHTETGDSDTKEHALSHLPKALPAETAAVPAGGASPERRTRAVGAKAREYQLYLIFDRAKVDAFLSSEALKAERQGADTRHESAPSSSLRTEFDAEHLCRLPNGRLLYNSSLFHHA